MRKYGVWIALFVSVLLISGCRRAPENRYELRGTVVSVDKAQRQAVIEHEEIPGLMHAMTMPFNVREDWVLEALAPGQSVEAALVVKGDRSWIEDVRISQSRSVDTPGARSVLPAPGDAVPGFGLVDQDGRPIDLAQFRGRPLLMTFIYTRCPLPDFCPRTNMNFAEVYRGLRSLPASDRKPRLLTVSFDTEYDKPAVLKEYARRFMNPPDFGEWTFATGSEEEIRAITGHFGLIYRHESGQITHSLVTALIAPDGRLEKLYLGNQWTPGEILAAYR